MSTSKRRNHVFVSISKTTFIEHLCARHCNRQGIQSNKTSHLLLRYRLVEDSENHTL